MRKGPGRARLPVLWLLAAGLAGCAAPPPAVPPPASPRRATLPRPPPAAPPVEAAWEFRVVSGTCTATLRHPDAVVEFAAGPAPMLRLAARGVAEGAARVTRLRFRGEAGAWSLVLRDAPATERRLDAAMAERLRALLAGGRLGLSRQDSQALALGVPDSGVSGRAWFGCVAALRPAPGAAPAKGPAEGPGEDASG
ncbi:hypothetical protein [Falsiroseomonas selenitidurans]|uniref:Lipoprotein n=1 Tax=Falsiroseomonas selenitidurans TaxID=2716335 RepID=A0ABX1E906_9PROT|nr:hypothetical protein [Falsiroseomonas selenitidurans]NKC33298.1 hypothetical protein [Falsiroseomonas selenitidurans]